MKKKYFIIILIVLVLASAGFFILQKSSANNRDKETESDKKIFVQRGDITIFVSATGTIEPLEVVEIKSKASGKIINMPVQQGDFLKKDDLIAEIEKTFAKPEVDTAQADLKSAQARLDQAKINIELAKNQSEIEINKMQEEVSSVKNRYEKLKAEIEEEKHTKSRRLIDAKNNLKIAKIKLKKIKIGSRIEDIKKAESNLVQLKAELELAKNQYERNLELKDKGFISLDILDNFKAKLDSLKAQYDQSTQNLEIVKNPFTEEEHNIAELEVIKYELLVKEIDEKIKYQYIREKDLEIYKSDMKKAELNLETAIANKANIELKEKELSLSEAQVVKAKVALSFAKDKLKDTVITAPVSGTILKKLVEEGQIISSGISQTSTGTAIATMADLSSVFIKANIDESDIGNINIGQKVKIVVDAFAMKKFRGMIIRIAPIGEVVQNVTTFEVTIQINNPEAILKPGMNASLEIIAADKKNVLFVPNEVIGEQDGKKIIMVLKNGKSIPQPVEIGVNDWKVTEIISGLEEGSEVVVNDKKDTGKDKKGGKNNNRDLSRAMRRMGR